MFLPGSHESSTAWEHEDLQSVMLEDAGTNYYHAAQMWFPPACLVSWWQQTLTYSQRQHEALFKSNFQVQPSCIATPGLMPCLTTQTHSEI